MKKILTVLAVTTLCSQLSAQPGGDEFAFSSVLQSGKWHRMVLTAGGVYRISYSRLAELGFSDPSKVRIFGNNYGQLSYFNSDPRPDDLKEIAVQVSTGTDGVFNEGDFIYFYASGTHRWIFDGTQGKYIFRRHNYSDTSVYFVGGPQGTPRSVVQASLPQTAATYVTESYDALFIKEEETENIIRSGREWYQPVSVIKGVEIDPGFQYLVEGEPIRYRLRVAGRSPVPVVFRMLENSETVVSVMVPEVNMFNPTGTFARYGEAEGTLSHSASPRYEIRFYNNGESSARGWLDWLWLHARANLTAGDRQFVFSDSRSAGQGVVNEYRISTTDNSLNVWDITDPALPRSIPLSFSGTRATFRDEADSLKRYVAFRLSMAMVPTIDPVPLENQNLHATGPCDMIIVTHPWFMRHAERLAQLHLENSGLVSKIVTPGQIYNEFSGGIPDVAAIRNYVRMVWLKSAGSDKPLKYLLLFGDGSFENKRLPPANPNFIPTWQTLNSNIVVSSFMSDDFYGLLDEGEGEASGFLDIGIGRLPVSDTLSATIVVNKIERYMNGSDPGPWRNMITIAADDEDGNLHMNDAENIALAIGNVNPAINIEKIYLDAFRQITTVNGQSYPDATRAINSRMEQGTLIFNYLGHGNEIGLAHERVVRTSDIASWKNLSRLSLFITATCEFSRFDDAEYNPITGTWIPKTSAGELALLNPTGGAIALMSTTRVVFSAPNFILNRNIYNYAFAEGDDGEQLRFGDIIRLAKVSSGPGTNKRNFSLLGDPALRLAYPFSGHVVTDSVNSRHVSMPADTLSALSEVTVSGHITDRNGNMMEGINGTITTTVYDKPVSVTTLANDGGLKMTFGSLHSMLFSGKAAVVDGRFTVKFMVPRDIDYNYGDGKISYYAVNNDGHYTGFYNEITVGGFSDRIVADSTGPAIRLFINDTLFRPGGIAGEGALLLALISDDNGINTTGAGIGHDLTLWMNGDRNNPVIINNFFESDFGDYRKGTLIYPLGNLKKGENTITLKAWDNYNNSSEASLVFVTGDEIRFIVADILNYPNPFSETTTIVAGHNRPGNTIEVEIRIHDMSGRVVRILRETTPPGGFTINPVEWDRTAADGSRAGSGTYIFTITLKTDNREIARGSGRMIIL